MTEDRKEYWFVLTGGYRPIPVPINWKGWAFCGAFGVVVCLGARFLYPIDPQAWWLFFVIATGAFIFVAWSRVDIG